MILVHPRFELIQYFGERGWGVIEDEATPGKFCVVLLEKTSGEFFISEVFERELRSPNEDRAFVGVRVFAVHEFV